MGAIALGSALYGGVRGLRDERRDDMEAQAFDTDQAIRRERLKNEQELGPLRKRSLELGVDEQQRQAIRRPQIESDEDTLRKLGIDTAKLGLEEKQDLYSQVRDARKKEERLKAGLGQFHTTGDPQHVADAIGDMYPKGDGSRPMATRNGDGSITLTSVDQQGQAVGKPIQLTTQKINGVDRSPEEQLAMYAYKLANPVEHLKNRLSTDLAVEKEGAKQEEITNRAIIREQLRGDARVAEVTARGERDKTRAVDRGVRLGKTFVDSSLKTVSVPGHFQATYSSDDDAKLLPHMYTRMGELVRKEDSEPEDAATKAITEVRTEFLGAKRAALDAAEKLRKAGINPKDKAALEKAKAEGNKDVDALLGALGKATRRFGSDVGNYLLEQIPASKK